MTGDIVNIDEIACANCGGRRPPVFYQQGNLWERPAQWLCHECGYWNQVTERGNMLTLEHGPTGPDR